MLDAAYPAVDRGRTATYGGFRVQDTRNNTSPGHAAMAGMAWQGDDQDCSPTNGLTEPCWLTV